VSSHADGFDAASEEFPWWYWLLFWSLWGYFLFIWFFAADLDAATARLEYSLIFFAQTTILIDNLPIPRTGWAPALGHALPFVAPFRLFELTETTRRSSDPYGTGK